MVYMCFWTFTYKHMYQHIISFTQTHQKYPEITWIHVTTIVLTSLEQVRFIGSKGHSAEQLRGVLPLGPGEGLLVRSGWVGAVGWVGGWGVSWGLVEQLLQLLQNQIPTFMDHGGLWLSMMQSGCKYLPFGAYWFASLGLRGRLGFTSCCLNCATQNLLLGLVGAELGLMDMF